MVTDHVFTVAAGTSSDQLQNQLSVVADVVVRERGVGEAGVEAKWSL